MGQRRSGMAIALVAVAAMSLASCSGSGDGGSKEQSITVRVYPTMGDDEKAFWDQQVAAFRKDHPNIQVKVDIQPWKDRGRALTASIAGGTAPDVVYMIPDELSQFQAQNVVEPLDGIVSAEGYRKNALDAVTIDGKLYGAPVLMSVIPGACDQKVLDAVGVEAPPTTWDELKALGPKFKEKGYYATTFVASNDTTLNTTFYPWMWQAGGAPFDASGAPTFNSPAAKKALSFMVDLVKDGYVPKDEVSLNLPAEQTVIGSRKVGCIYHLDPVIVKDYWGDDVVVAPVLKDVASRAYGTVGSYTLLKSSKNKEAAAAWINYITSPTAMGALDTKAGYLPPKEAVPVTYAEDSIEARTGEYLDLADVGPRAPEARELQSVIAPELQAAVLGDKTVDDALAAAQQAAVAKMKRG